MKKLIVFILFTFVAFGNLNASTLDGVLGLKFGCSREEVKQIMLNKPDFKLEKSNNSKDELVYSAGIFSGRDVHSLILKFTDDKLYSVIITIKPILGSLLIDTYKAMKKEISEKYFNPNDELEDYDFPNRNYKPEIAFILLGKSKVFAKWNFSNASHATFTNNITLSVLSDLSINLNYTDGYLYNIVSRSDY